MVCPTCKADADFIGHRPKTWITPVGPVEHRRAYYHCEHCKSGHFPFDTANGLQRDHISTGLRPLVGLAGVLAGYRVAAEDVLYSFTGVRLSASAIRDACKKAGAKLAQRQQSGDLVVPAKPEKWDFSVAGHSGTVAYLGLDAFSVPMQQSGGGKAPGRMLYTAVLYTPDKSRSHYLVDFDLARLAEQIRQAVIKLGLGRADKLIAILDAGNGLVEALRRNLTDDLLCILDWYHASEHLSDYSKCLFPKDADKASAWWEAAKGVLYEEGGKELLAHLRSQSKPEDAAVAEELRKLIGYFEGNSGRTDYPEYRKQGWDIGSGPTEAACKTVGARLKQSGMRWLEAGAAEIAPLRALYLSGTAAWEAFWALAA
jgi:hypothetical protein